MGRESLKSMSVTRRRLLGTAAAFGALAPMLGKMAFAQDGVVLTVVSYGGAYQEAQTKTFFDAFTKENAGITIRQESPTSNAKLKAMVDAGDVIWDIALVDDSFGLEADAAWLEPIDYSVLNKDDFLPGYADTYRVGADVEGTVIAYRDDKFTGAKPASFADLFDTKAFPGKRAFWKFAPGGIMEAALIADGVSADKLYPLDIERALKKLDTIKDDIIWWEAGAQAEQLLTSGEATMGHLWIGRTLEAAKNAPVKIAWGQWTTQNGWWVVPKGTKNKDAAMKALKFFTSAAAQTEFTKLIAYGGTNKNAMVAADSPFTGNLPTEHLETRVVVDMAWWNANQAKVDPLFQDWLLQ